MSGDTKPITRERNSSLKNVPVNSKSKAYLTQVQKDRDERENIVLWKAPLKTLVNFALELVSLLSSLFARLYQARLKCLLISSIFAFLYFIYNIEGAHQQIINDSKDQLLWGLYWIWLGILSSVGLGTGLHTFLLFLGPFIAKVTLAAYECGSTDFPSPPFPDEIVCPEGGDQSQTTVTILMIASKVRFAACCWGAGTALGELPPYFMARAARLSGQQDEDDEEMAEFEDLLAVADKNEKSTDLITRGKLFMHDLVKRVGFFGILAAASIPNPLFDLAGITCGHFLVPFWTFFGATLIGKAIIKTHIQQFFIIFLFSKQYVDMLLAALLKIPVLGEKVHSPISVFFEKQRKKLHSGQSDDSGNLIGQCFEIFIFVMVGYFIVTIVNSLAQSRVAKKQKEARNTKFSKIE